jgi:hypothetical protein
MTSFATRIRPAVQAELDAARAEEARGHFYSAFGRLERAHVLGQSATTQHVRVHWMMLRFALRNGLCSEAAGQLWRLAAAALFTPLGLVPEGNTGGSDVNGLRRMKLPQDLQAAIAAARG